MLEKNPEKPADQTLQAQFHKKSGGFDDHSKKRKGKWKNEKRKKGDWNSWN